MISPKKSTNHSDNGNKCRALTDITLKKLSIDLQPFLKDKNLNALKTLIKKYECLSLDEIEHNLFTNLNSFKPTTQHKIREFLNRRLKIDRKAPNSDANPIYQSDDSNLVSPYSRDSFSSRSEVTLSPSIMCQMKADIGRLWRYPDLQKAVCQLLADNDDLQLMSNTSIALNFDSLKPTSLLALQELIIAKTKYLDRYLSDRNIKVIHDAFMDESALTDDKVDAIIRTIRKREVIEADENGRFTFDVTKLRADTVADLVRLLQPTKSAAQPMKRAHSSSRPTGTASEGTASRDKRPATVPIATAVRPPQAGFDTEQLRHLSRKLREFTSGDRIKDILHIVRQHETVDEQSGGVSLNIKKMRSITIEKLFDYINANDL